MKIDDIKKVKGKRIHRMNADYGIADAYKFYKNAGGPLPEKTYKQIIKKVHKYYSDNLCDGKEVIFPKKMGVIDVVFRKPKLYRDDSGKIQNNYPVDWKRTLELWAEDNDAREKRILVKDPQNKVYRVYYHKKLALYTNKSHFGFKPCRTVKLALKDAMLSGRLKSIFIV